MKLDDKTLRAAVREADSRYYDLVKRMAAQHQKDAAARKGRHLMGKIVKYAVGGIVTAALLCGGGIAAIVAMRGHNGGNSSTESSRDVSSVIEEIKKQNQAQKNLHLNLTGPEWCEIFAADNFDRYSTDWYTGTDAGWYHSKDASVWNDWLEYTKMTDAEKEEYNEVTEEYLSGRTNPNMIWYYDRETGEDVTLCDRPNCLHDGNDFCEATSGKYYRGALMYYDGALYAAACTPDKRICLLSYALDGTGITELATFEKGEGESCGIVIHRGYVFCLFRVYQGGAPQPMTDPMQYDANVGSGFVIWGYEIATGKTTELLRALPEAKNSKGYESMPVLFTAGGDYVYFGTNTSWPETYTKGFYGIDLNTGECKCMANVSQAAATGKYLLYITEELGSKVFRILNTETGESTDYSNIPSGSIASDGTHVFVKKDGSLVQEKQATVYVYDMQMNPLGEISVGEGYDLNVISVSGGYLYAERGFLIDRNGNPTILVSPDVVLIRCKVEDILNGTAEWEELCMLFHDEKLSDLLAKKRKGS